MGKGRAVYAGRITALACRPSPKQVPELGQGET
jgi:hypothetical protein